MNLVVTDELDRIDEAFTRNRLLSTFPAEARALLEPFATVVHLDRNALFDRGLRPHAYCLPVAKREKHRQAVRRAATSGSPKVFLGTDSAPHPRHAKESPCGCAGIFNAPFALEAYATVFEEDNALDRLEAFASENGPRFYGLPLNEGSVTLRQKNVQVPETIANGADAIIPFLAGTALGWSLV